jgi:hypothetical protein
MAAFTPKLEGVGTLRALTARLAGVDRRIVDVRRALEILRTAPWEFGRLPDARLNSAIINLEVRQLEGVGGAGADEAENYRKSPGAKVVGLPKIVDSPFWTAVSNSLQVLAYSFRWMQEEGEPDIIDQRVSSENILGGNGQVFAVFPLIILIFATFDIPVPCKGSALWSAWTTVNYANADRDEVPVFDMIDLEAQSSWYTANAGNKDRHRLKEKLRRGKFRMRGRSKTVVDRYGRIHRALDDGALAMDEQAVLRPWADDRSLLPFAVGEQRALLPTLVGAVKGLRAKYVHAGRVWDPLVDACTHCEAVLARLELERQELQFSLRDQTVHSVTAPPPLTEDEQNELLALARRGKSTPINVGQSTTRRLNDMSQSLQRLLLQEKIKK